MAFRWHRVKSPEALSPTTQSSKLTVLMKKLYSKSYFATDAKENMTNTGQQNCSIANLLYCATFLGENWHFEKKAQNVFEDFQKRFLNFQRKDSMEFLHDIVPKKVKFGDYLKMMEEEKSSDEEDEDLL